MTGAGTNTYLVGCESIVVVDPGPAIAAHVDALWQAVAGKLEAILVTHTHHDHSPAAALLAARSGAPVYGALSSHTAWQDASFAPDVELVDGQRLAFAAAKLRALHTPGHVDNHFCFLLEESGLLFAGDHMMQGSTVVIAPPQGDMAAYIASLRQLSSQPLQAIAPAHGELMLEPVQEIERLIAHRMRRETKVYAALVAAGSVAFEALLAQVYDDVDPHLHSIAQHSLLAHLLKLEKESRVLRITPAAQSSALCSASIAEAGTGARIDNSRWQVER
ncbi:MAG: MBL fold metallo-hydrolase [Pseudomonadales bacterium]|nr:MBL fold metallo-hydrolase [Pseudomonadales bacterium]